MHISFYPFSRFRKCIPTGIILQRPEGNILLLCPMSDDGRTLRLSGSNWMGPDRERVNGVMFLKTVVSVVTKSGFTLARNSSAGQAVLGPPNAGRMSSCEAVAMTGCHFCFFSFFRLQLGLILEAVSNRQKGECPECTF